MRLRLLNSASLIFTRKITQVATARPLKPKFVANRSYGPGRSKKETPSTGAKGVSRSNVLFKLTYDLGLEPAAALEGDQHQQSDASIQPA